MDSLTHIVLGACVGEVVAGKKLGKKALAWGALMNSLPDFDFVLSFFLNPTKDLLAHRGITHSLFFVAIATPLLAWIASRIHRHSPMRFKDFLWFFGLEIFLHIFLDTFNVYGTGWWEPFLTVRWSWDFLFVADPLFTIGLLVVALMLVFKSIHHPKRKKWALIAITVSVCYTAWGGVNKYLIDTRVQAQAKRNGIEVLRYFSTPTALNHQLFYCLLQARDGIYITYRSVWDGNRDTYFSYYHQNKELAAQIIDQEALRDLKIFSQDWYALKKDSIGIQFQDMRFGQILGWEYQPAEFIFYYYIDEPEANALVVQRGRVKGWNREVLKRYLYRIRGGWIQPRIL
ncbi:metal-dependent hydrolase [Gynurincola endophyticus]|uniref:metal-dependent hydrolase n=1 Tax=Gynurincola endophyticus TaxID=2479004 RepID=UPI000F8E8703|nr:metal-dependent hydrolase [Gynurincola endophyticus]